MGNSSQQSKVVQVAQQWSRYANISLIPTSDPTSANIRITFDPSIGSWSYIGIECTAVPAPDPTMNLALIREDDKLTDDDQGHILHQFGHALGFPHDPMSFTRWRALTLNEEGMCSCNHSGCRLIAYVSSEIFSFFMMGGEIGKEVAAQTFENTFRKEVKSDGAGDALASVMM